MEAIVECRFYVGRTRSDGPTVYDPKHITGRLLVRNRGEAPFRLWRVELQLEHGNVRVPDSGLDLPHGRELTAGELYSLDVRLDLTREDLRVAVTTVPECEPRQFTFSPGRGAEREIAEVFVSYSSRDSAVVFKVVDELIWRGVRCWIDRREVETADWFAQKIPAGLGKSDVMLLFASREARCSPWVRGEMELAAKQLSSGSLKAVFGVPVSEGERLADVEAVEPLPWIAEAPDCAEAICRRLRMITRAI